MKVTLQGIRGSMPTPLSPNELHRRIDKVVCDYDIIRTATNMDATTYLASQPKHFKEGFGGNTACVEVDAGDTKIIIDGGSGIRNTLPELMSGHCGKGTGTINIFLTHFHWDHILGLPFFVPLYIPGNTVNFYAVQPELEKVIKQLFTKPFFPVPFEMLGASITFNQLEPRKEFELGELKITPYQLDHPDPCWGFKITDGNKTYSHCVDTEATRHKAEDLGDDLPLYQNVDLMLFDAQYSYDEAQEKKNWGHSSAPIGLEIALRENIKEIVFAHHDPMASDEQIASIGELAVQYFESSKNVGKENIPKWSIAQEGTVYEL